MPTQPYAHIITALLSQHGVQNEAQILDVGCGTGIYSQTLAEHGYDVTGIDAANGMLAHAYPRVTSQLTSRLRFQKVNVDAGLPYADRMFDGAIAISVLQALSDPEEACREIWRVLKPNSVFVVLHMPKPAYYEASFVGELRVKINLLKRKSLVNMVLTTAKALGQRLSPQLYWTDDELRMRLCQQGFQFVAMPVTQPIIMVVRRPSETQLP